jgi:hypothetical protein
VPDILSVQDLMARYRCERHTASKIMSKLPKFRVGKRLFVKAVDLLNWEESRIEYPMTEFRRTVPTITKIPRRAV